MTSQVELQVKCVHNGKYNVFVIADDEYIGRSISNGCEWDGWMRSDIEKYYTPGTDILDIGANIGYNSLMFSDYGPVHAFEPIFYKLVDLNAKNNKIKNPIHIYSFALSDVEHSVDMYIPNKVEASGLRNYGGTSMYKTDGFDETTKTSVECHRLDDIYKGKPSVIKIDVEGHEMEVLKGSENTIKKYMPTLLIEIFDFENNEVPKYLKSLGYEDPEIRPEHVYLYRAKDIFSTI
jgi:FkbM family methyltransferase